MINEKAIKGYVLRALINSGVSQDKAKEVIEEIEMLLSEISPDQAEMYYDRTTRRE